MKFLEKLGKFLLPFLFIVIFWLIRPIMFIFHLICNLAYSPDVKQPTLGLPNTQLDPKDFSWDVSKYYTGDGAKFISQAYMCMQTEELWEQVKTFWDWENKAFFRVDKPKRAFSGDMMAGMMPALAVRYREGKLTSEEKQFIADVAWNMTFNNWIPFRFKHDDTSRGYYWNPFSPGVNCNTQVLGMLKMGKMFSTNWLRKLALSAVYYPLLLISIPFYLFGMCDHIIFYKRVCACWWYGTHSDALTYAGGALLNIPFNRLCLHKLDERYGSINADISAINYALCWKEENKETTYSIVTDLIKSRDGSTFTFEKRRYYSLRHILKNGGKWIDEFKRIFKESDNKFADFISNLKNIGMVFDCWQEWNDTWSAGYCCHDRTWERNFLDHGKPRSNLGDLDIVFPLRVVQGCLNFDKPEDCKTYSWFMKLKDKLFTK